MAGPERRIRNGYVLSIVNIKGEADKGFKRPGAEKDGDIIIDIFVKRFGSQTFKEGVKYFLNLKATDFNHELSLEDKPVANCTCVCCLLKRTKFTGMDCLVLTVSSHGCLIDGEEMIQFVDGELLPVSEVYKAVDIPTLKKITKILIIQACRSRPGS